MAAATLPAEYRPAWPKSFSPSEGLHLCDYFFLFLEKPRPVPLQLASDELYHQVSEAFAELDPEGP